MTIIPSCPVCEGNGVHVKRLVAELIRHSLERYYAETVPKTIQIVDYNLLRCSKCSLEYACPLIPGDEDFYRWITQRPGYYTTARWEWPIVTHHVAEVAALQKASLLEVGCGSGQFLRRIQAACSAVTAIGIDVTKDSIAVCRGAGLRAYSESVETYLGDPKYPHKQFDFIVAFHVLEHVPDPRNWVRSMLALSHDKSWIFISTPYSPMSFEASWYDPLNHPPHHLTRWNADSYGELARSLDLTVELVVPPAANILSRALRAVHLVTHGPGAGRGLGYTAAAHPLLTVREFGRQLCRDRANGRIASDSVLARFNRRLH